MPQALEAEHHAERGAVEAEVADLQADRVRVGFLKIPEVAVVEAQPDVVREVAHYAGADIPPEVVFSEVPDVGDRGDVLADVADAERGVRPDAAALLSADWSAHDQVRHQRDDARAV